MQVASPDYRPTRLSTPKVQLSTAGSFVMHGLTVSPMGTQHVRLINPYRAIDDNRDFEDFTQCFEDAKKASYPQNRFFEYHG